jgi:hypothetical protein
MNKKGIIAAIVVIILVIGGYMLWGGKSSSTSYAPSGATATVTLPGGATTSKDAFAPVTKDTADASLVGRLKSVSVSAAETGSRVALVDGKAQFDAGGSKGSLALGDIAVEATLGSVKYAFTTIGVAVGGVTYQYVVLFTDDNGALTDQSYDVLGQGVQVTGLRADALADGLAVTATFKYAAGNPHSKILVVENGAFNPAKDVSF